MVTIQIQESVAERLAKSATAHGLSLEDYLEQLVLRDAGDLDRAIAAAMPTLEELDAMSEDPCEEWRRDDSWKDSR